MSEITIVDLVRNGTLNAEMAAVLWAAVDEQLSFLTVARPRLAGKTTTANAVLGLRAPEVEVHPVAGEPNVMERLKAERRGGYISVNEFSQAPMYGYIWGEAVQRVFDTLPYGYALQTSLHAGSVEEAIDVVTRGNGVSDEQASAFKLVLYIERFGTDSTNFWRRLVQLYELHKVENGRPIGHPLFRWRQADDSFEQVSEPHQFGRDSEDIQRRANLVRDLAENGRRSPQDIAEAVRKYRDS